MRNDNNKNIAICLHSQVKTIFGPFIKAGHNVAWYYRPETRSRYLGKPVPMAMSR